MAGEQATPWAAPSSRRLLAASAASTSGLDLRAEGITRRYSLVLKIASGGMGAVYLGFQSGAAGFRRAVAIKRAHAHLLEDPEFRKMLINESRLASLVRHPNAVSVCDVDVVDGELLLVMEYVEGGTLSELMASERPLPATLALRIIADACRGLDAIHTATDSRGDALKLVHRDVSPQNILVGIDGVARIADFGIAKAYEVTTSGLLRGKPAYMAPEYIATGVATSATDVFALGVVAWECLTRRRLFRSSSDVETLERVRNVTIPPPSAYEPGLPWAVEETVLRALARDVDARYQTAREFGTALEAVISANGLVASPERVGEHVRAIVGDMLAVRRQALVEETLAQGTSASIDIPIAVEEDSAETPLTHEAVLVPQPKRRWASSTALTFGLTVAALAVTSAVFFRYYRSSAPAAGQPPAAMTALRVDAPEASAATAPVGVPVDGNASPPANASPPERDRGGRPSGFARGSTVGSSSAARLSGLRGMAAPVRAPEPTPSYSSSISSATSSSTAAPSAATSASGAAVRPSATTLVAAPPAQAPDNPYR